MTAEMDPATVLEEAADLLLIKGRCTGVRALSQDGPFCVVGAIEKARTGQVGRFGVASPEGDPYSDPVVMLLQQRLPEMVGPNGRFVDCWNDNTADDFEVIDTLRLVAKDIRNEAKS